MPEVLMSGDHKEIKDYRRRQAILKCRQNRPDLLAEAELSDEEIEYLKKLDENSVVK